MVQWNGSGDGGGSFLDLLKVLGWLVLCVGAFVLVLLVLKQILT